MKRNYNEVCKMICSFIRNEISNRNALCAVIGLSGGLDSSVVLKLAVQSLGNKHVIGLILPEIGITPTIDIDDAQELANHVGLTPAIIQINEIKYAFMQKLEQNKVAEGNLSARIRMSILYHFAKLNNSLVIGTTDKSELMLGYFTKYGDGGADIYPIANLYKTEVRELARYLQLPRSICEKKSGPRLWLEHDAESELGLQYEKIDTILRYRDNFNSNNINDWQNSIDINDFDKVNKIIARNKHKTEGFAICNV